MLYFSKASGEFIVEEHTRGFQRHPELATLGAGFCVAWTDDTIDHCGVGGPDVRAKIFMSSGTPLGREFIVNTETIDHQRDPRIAGLANGRLVAIWQDFSGRGGDGCDSGLKAKLFDETGHVFRDEFLVNVKTAGRQFNASVGALTGGNFVVVWQTGAAGSSRILARVFMPNGDASGTEILVDENSQSQADHPMVAPMPDGSFILVWSERTIGPRGPLEMIKARQFFGDGSPQGEEVLVNPDATVDQKQLSIVGLHDGSFAVVWAEISGPSPFISLGCRVFEANGEPRGGGVQVSSNALDRAHSAALAALDGGQFVVAWTHRNGPGSEIAHNVNAKLYSNDGAAHGQTITVGNPSRNQGNPSVVAIRGGGFAVAWEEMTGTEDHAGTCVKAQVFLPANP